MLTPIENDSHLQLLQVRCAVKPNREKKGQLTPSSALRIHRNVTSFAEIAAQYRVIFFDAYGVLKNSSGILPGVPDALKSLAKKGSEFFVITNDASKSPVEMASVYAKGGLAEHLPEERNISSGMLASEFLRAHVRQGRVAYLGKKQSEYYIRQAGLEPVAIGTIHGDAEISALVFLDDEGFDWFADINKAINLLRLNEVTAVVANTDLAYPVDANEVAIAVGSLADMAEAITKKTFIRFGKPDVQIFAFALARAAEQMADLEKKDILMVGDTLHTDILGANKFGIDTALVLTGNTLASTHQSQISATGIKPTHICNSVAD